MRMSEMSAVAVREAERLGHAELDPEHLVLAILHPEGESAARRALEACGLTYERLRGEIEKPPTTSSAAGRPFRAAVGS